MAAFLCDRILIETDGVKSAIRIVDRVTRNLASQNPPEQMAPFDYDLTLLVSLKAGWTHGSYPPELMSSAPTAIPGQSLITLYFSRAGRNGVSIRWCG